RPARRAHDRQHARAPRDGRRPARAGAEARAEDPREDLRHGRAEEEDRDPQDREAFVTSAVLAPGYGGTAEQPLLRKLAARLEADGIATSRITFSTKRPSRGYVTEKAELRAARDLLVARAGAPVALVGRSFGGRMCAFLAAEEPPAALVLLGH